MSASKDTKRGTWKVYIRYKDWQGVGQVHTKRGFATKREALEYEREFLLKKSKDVNMGFPQFVEVYMEDMKPRLKLNTFLTKKHIMETKIIPYFEKKSLAEITATDVIQWQNQLLSMRDENGMLYKCDEHTRLFTFSKSYLHHEMDRGAKAAGVKRIRIHDLRHSHVAHCIELGFSPVAIAERMGHEGINITFNYAHLYPSKQKALADKLNKDRGDVDATEKKEAE